MLRESLLEIFERDLNKLAAEINFYLHEPNIWITEKTIGNSAGNLCLHICGNLKNYIGAKLGNSGYKRDRAAEFSSKNISKNELLQNIEETSTVVKKTLNSLNETEFHKIYPEDVLNKKMTTEFFLIHLATHLNYHIGQINYHRRLLDQPAVAAS